MYTRVHFAELFKRFRDKRMLVFWVGHLIPSLNPSYQPKVVIYLREIFKDNSLGVSTVNFEVSISESLLFRIGSIWQKGKNIGERNDLKTIEFISSFNESDFELINLESDLEIFHHSSYDFPLANPIKHSKILKLRDILKKDVVVLVPCLEIFNRIFGHNSELRRILTVYKWTEVLERCFEDLGYLNPDNEWHIKLPKIMRDADSVQLAHMKYDKYAIEKIKQIRLQIHNSYSPKGAPSFVDWEITPWFKGQVHLRVKGKWLNKTTFLALQINGASQPKGKPIKRIKSAITQVSSDYIESEELSGNTYRSVLNSSQEEVEIATDTSPDREGPAVQILEDSFVILGEARLVEKVIEHKDSKGVTQYSSAEEASQYSTGEGHGSGKDTGKAYIKTPIIFESFGVLKDLWDELIRLQKDEKIKSVEYFTSEQGFSNILPLKLEPFSPIPADEELSIKIDPSPKNTKLKTNKTYEEKLRAKEQGIRNWIYIDKNGKRARGSLIIRAMTNNGKSIYFLEIERREINKKDPKTGETSIGEENFRGIAFTLYDDLSLTKNVNLILDLLVRKLGVLKELPKDFKGDIHRYNHSKKNISIGFYANIITNALLVLK